MALVPMRSSGLEKHHDQVQKDTLYRIPRNTLEGKLFPFFAFKCAKTFHCLSYGFVWQWAMRTCFVEVIMHVVQQIKRRKMTITAYGAGHVPLICSNIELKRAHTHTHTQIALVHSTNSNILKYDGESDLPVSRRRHEITLNLPAARRLNIVGTPVIFSTKLYVDCDEWWVLSDVYVYCTCSRAFCYHIFLHAIRFSRGYGNFQIISILKY